MMNEKTKNRKKLHSSHIKIPSDIKNNNQSNKFLFNNEDTIINLTSKNLSNISIKKLNLTTNNFQKKSFKNIPLINIKKNIFSLSPFSQSSNSRNNSKSKDKFIRKIPYRKETWKSSFSIGNTNTEITNTNTSCKTFSKKNSSSERNSIKNNETNIISSFTPNSNKIKLSDDTIKCAEIINKIKGICLISGIDQFLSNDFVLDFKSPVKRGKCISRNITDLIHSPEKIYEKKMRVESIFGEIDNCLNSANKLKNKSFIYSNKNPMIENYFTLSNIQNESEKRISNYMKLFNLCKQKFKEISNIILESYNKLNWKTDKENFPNFEDSTLCEQDIDLTNNIFNENISTPIVPSSRIISVNKPKQNYVCKGSLIKKLFENTNMKVVTSSNFYLSIIGKKDNENLKVNYIFI